MIETACSTYSAFRRIWCL